MVLSATVSITNLKIDKYKIKYFAKRKRFKNLHKKKCRKSEKKKHGFCQKKKTKTRKLNKLTTSS